MRFLDGYLQHISSSPHRAPSVRSLMLLGRCYTPCHHPSKVSLSPLAGDMDNVRFVVIVDFHPLQFTWRAPATAVQLYKCMSLLCRNATKSSRVADHEICSGILGIFCCCCRCRPTQQSDHQHPVCFSSICSMQKVTSLNATLHSLLGTVVRVRTSMSCVMHAQRINHVVA